MLLHSLVKLALFGASTTNAYFILSHKGLETTRLDPIISPGNIGGHVHSIVGASSFDKTMTYASSRSASCTTSPVSVDLSSYWTPQLYYYSPTANTFQAIELSFVNTYYLPRPAYTGERIYAFPDGLRMISGTSTQRTFVAGSPDAEAVSFVCLDATNSGAAGQWNYLPTHQCPSGMRAQINFPSCWDGVNLDSSDHKSHMSWPSGGVNGGSCPSTHPVHLPMLFYEFIYNVQNYPFNDPSYPTWVFANGDTTGYGFHGDFINGWPSLVNGTNVLQQAIDGCNANNGVGGELNNCPPFVPFLNSASANSCQPQNPLVAEDVGFGHGLTALPGNNPVTANGVSSGPGPTATGFQNTSSTIPSGWNHIGCIAEAASGRALTGTSMVSTSMNRSTCVSFCQSKGFNMAGVEYGKECYCDSKMENGASNTTLLDPSQCGIVCSGLSTENCGGSRTLELFSNWNLGTPSTSTTAVASSATTASPSTTSTSAAPTSTAIVSTIPAGYSLTGCIAEGTSGRALNGASYTSSAMSINSCVSFCASKGMPLAGIEYASECYCGFYFVNGGTNATLLASSKCGMRCSNTTVTETCGGSSALQLYNNPSLYPVPAALPSGWAYSSCNVEAQNARALSSYSFTSSSMTRNLCINGCAAKGYTMAGVEYSSECYCGNSFTNGGGAVAAASDCSMPCSGDASSTCGGSSRLSVFVMTGSNQPASSSSATPSAATTTAVALARPAPASTSTSSAVTTTAVALVRPAPIASSSSSSANFAVSKAAASPATTPSAAAPGIAGRSSPRRGYPPRRF